MLDDVDAEAFGVFVADRLQALMRASYLLTGHRQRAEDLVQAALLKAVRYRSSASQTASPVEDWERYVRKIMYHENISAWRQLRARAESGAPVPDTAHPDTTWQVDLRLVLRRALLQLTVKQRTVVVMRYFDDLSETQVAASLGLSVGSVRSQTAKALKRLRDLVPAASDLWAVKEPA